MNRHVLSGETSSRMPSGSTLPPFSRAILPRFAHKPLVSERSVAKPSEAKSARMTSFMYWMRPFPFAHTKPSGKLSSAPMSESCVIDSDAWRISSTRPALVRKRKNAASRMKRYTQLSPKREIMGGVHNAMRTISSVMTGLRFAIASTKPNAAIARFTHRSTSSGNAYGRNCANRTTNPREAEFAVQQASTRCTTISIS